jgi:hypothetical protein
MSDLYVTPSTLEVDYDKNLTELYRAITDQKWDRAIAVCRKYPVQAATWVVRHYEDDNEIMWRFLPIHSACARQPPASLIQALLRAYPDGAKCIDDQGMYALHYACGNQASRDVIRQLLVHFPEAAKIADPRGMLPIHYLACWGPSSVAVVDMLLVAHHDVGKARDEDGNAPLDLAREGDYPEREAVIRALTKKWNTKKSSRSLTLIAEEDDDEKKDEESYLHSPASSMGATSPKSQISPRNASEVSRLEEQIRKLRGELGTHQKTQKTKQVQQHGNQDPEPSSTSNTKTRKIELEWQKRYNDLENQMDTRERELGRENKLLREEEVELRKEMGLLQADLQIRSMSGSEKDQEIESLKKDLDESTDENRELRDTLGDLMEQHNAFKKRSHNLSDRLGSLSVSLESMMDQQQTLTTSMRARNEQYTTVLQKRQEKLQELEKLEQTLEADGHGLDSSLEKQMKEMEVIAAVIAAARQ